MRKIKTMMKKAVTFALVASLALVPTMGVMADGTEESYEEDTEEAVGSMSDVYVSFGADLKEDQKATVMKLLGVTNEDLENVALGEITNEMEHEYLDSYLSADVIGKRALSSVKVTLKEEGNGINVTTHNINYCTAGMYTNALVTAGIKDADVVVAGPFNISGTAALIGTMNAYSAMTGMEIAEVNVDAAVNELVITGSMSEKIGTDQAEELFAMIKKKVVEEGLDSDEEINKAIEEVASQLEITLSDSDRQMILELMKKISDLDLDIDSILDQAKGLYSELQELNESGFFDKLIAMFEEFIRFIQSLLG